MHAHKKLYCDALNDCFSSWISLAVATLRHKPIALQTQACHCKDTAFELQSSAAGRAGAIDDVCCEIIDLHAA